MLATYLPQAYNLCRLIGLHTTTYVGLQGCRSSVHAVCK